MVARGAEAPSIRADAADTPSFRRELQSIPGETGVTGRFLAAYDELLAAHDAGQILRVVDGYRSSLGVQLVNPDAGGVSAPTASAINRVIADGNAGVGASALTAGWCELFANAG